MGRAEGEKKRGGEEENGHEVIKMQEKGELSNWGE